MERERGRYSGGRGEREWRKGTEREGSRDGEARRVGLSASTYRGTMGRGAASVK